MGKFYYHITDPKNVPDILRNGLKCNDDGDIFVFENKTLIVKDEFKSEYEKYGLPTKIIVAEYIAKNQVFLEEAAMLEIDANGINSDLIADNVAEITAKYQWIVKQPVIKPEFITHFCTVNLGEKEDASIERNE